MSEHKKNFLIAHPTGSTFVRQTLLAMEEKGVLGLYVTTLAFKSQALRRYLPRGPWMKELDRRSYDDFVLSKVVRDPWRETFRLMLGRTRFRELTCGDRSWCSIDRVYQHLDLKACQMLKMGSYDAVYGYEDGSLELFKAAKKSGLRCYYDLPIAHWKALHALQEEEALRYPDWAITMEGIQDGEDKLRRKDDELELADVVICPSQFVLDSLPSDIRKKKECRLARFGCDLREAKMVDRSQEKVLKICFVGTHTQRKGLADLFEAMKILGNTSVELHTMGSLCAPLAFYKDKFNDIFYHGTGHRERVLEMMSNCDVFCLPSIVEGRALVQLEALSCGLPLIITNNTGGDDLVIEGKTGFMVPIRRPEAIANKISWFADHRDNIPEMKSFCIEMALEKSWSLYRSELKEALHGLRI